MELLNQAAQVANRTNLACDSASVSLSGNGPAIRNSVGSSGMIHFMTRLPLAHVRTA